MHNSDILYLCHITHIPGTSDMCQAPDPLSSHGPSLRSPLQAVGAKIQGAGRRVLVQVSLRLLQSDPHSTGHKDLGAVSFFNASRTKRLGRENRNDTHQDPESKILGYKSDMHVGAWGLGTWGLTEGQV